ncbi:MAG: BBP7 family outer membrane beta-barrel protein [Planctomycetes bacterium]|nr:BBP7 family outer membrane beta-barrel protein [Planctomycetota bacterium]
MANSARHFVLFLTAALWVGGAAAQDLPFSDAGDELPQDFTLPLSDAQGPAGMGAPEVRDQSVLMESVHDPKAPFSGYEDGGFDDFGPEMHGHWPGLAPIESTGTWLRRGFWYAEADGVIWNRLWNRDDKLYAAQDPQVNSPTFFSRLNPVPILTTNRLMYLESAHPGQDGSVRATLGNFLFRDARNRDHTAEFTAFGGGDWQQDRVITSTVNFGLQVPFYIDGFNRSFDNSTRQTIDYGSDYKSFELNYRVKQRLGRDQLVMDANGQWHRAAHSGFERDYLAGLRFMNLGESLDWQAEDIVVLGDDGRYQVETDNDMIGFQLGGGFTYQAPRWSIGISCKGGIFANDATGQTILDFTADDDDDATLFLKEDELSFIGEARLLGRFHLTPNISLRAAYEMMFLDSVALAPSQTTFIPEFAFLNTTGDPFYHGASFGFEGYW